MMIQTHNVKLTRAYQAVLISGTSHPNKVQFCQLLPQSQQRHFCFSYFSTAILGSLTMISQQTIICNTRVLLMTQGAM